MMESMFYILLVISFASFFAALFMGRRPSKDGEGTLLTIMMYVISIAFFFISAVSSVSIDVVTGATITSYGGNAVVGLVAMGFGILAAVMMMKHLPEVFA